jgi:hypothetical protein
VLLIIERRVEMILLLLLKLYGKFIMLKAAESRRVAEVSLWY